MTISFITLFFWCAIILIIIGIIFDVIYFVSKIIGFLIAVYIVLWILSHFVPLLALIFVI